MNKKQIEPTKTNVDKVRKEALEAISQDHGNGGKCNGNCTDKAVKIVKSAKLSYSEKKEVTESFPDCYRSKFRTAIRLATVDPNSDEVIGYAFTEKYNNNH